MNSKSTIRNIGIFAHIDSGKTTLFERILYETGFLSSPGSVEDGTTESDILPEEIARGISIFSTTTQFTHKYNRKKYTINIIDTPGHLDFFAQVESCLLAIDIAVLLIDITTGIRTQTEIILEEILEKQIPLIIYINKIDKKVELKGFIESLRPAFRKKLLPVFQITDPIENKLEYIFSKKEIPEEVGLPFIEWKEELIDKYFKSPDNKIILKGLNEGFSENKFIPLFAGSALYGIGISELLDFICSNQYNRRFGKDHDISALIFKRRIYPELGRVYFLKTYKDLKIGDSLFLKDRELKLEKFYQFTSEEILEPEELDAYTICAVPGDINESLPIGFLKDKKNEIALIEKSGSFEFVILLEPNDSSSRKKLEDGLKDLVWEDHGLIFDVKPDTGQFGLYGSGELHLEVSINRLKEFVGEIFVLGNLRVARYEKLKNVSKRVIFDHSVFEGKLRSGTLIGFVEKSQDFSSTVSYQCELPEDFKNSVESAFLEVLSNGNNGYPVLGVNLRVLSYDEPEQLHESIASLLKVAIISGVKTLIVGNTVEIGPLSIFEIIVPDAYLGTVLAALNKREARIHTTDTGENRESVILGEAPAENMLGFTGVLRNMTKGKGFLSQKTAFTSFSHYEF